MAAAYKKRRSLPRDFISLIFGKEQMTLSDCIPVYDELERNPAPISRITSDEEIILQLLSDFDRYASRIARFFSILNKNSANRSRDGARRKSWVGPGLADALTEHILLPLLGDDFSQFQLGPPFLDAFSAVLDCCISYNPRSFEKLARNLVEERSVFVALISGKTTGGIMKQWIGVFTNTVSDYQVISAWTKRLIEQCDSCDGNHGIEQEKSRWQALDSVLPHLIRALRNHPQPTPGVPRQPLRLGSDLNIALHSLGIAPPASESALERAIQRLEQDETVRMLKAVSGSFPCRPCYELSTDPSSLRVADRDELDTWDRLGFMRFTDLLGAGIGMWRVLASSQALEDMQQAYAEGSFDMVESTLMQLSSGMWDRPAIQQTVGEGDSFLYLAPYGKDQKSGVLWQLDVEFNESKHCLFQSIKVWRIGEIGAIEQAETHIRLIHKTYSGVRLRAYRQLSIDIASGTAYPASYESDTDGLSGTLELDEQSQKQLAESLLRFNKFYTVTQTTFNNIRAENLTAEYPLSLAEEELEIVKETKASTLIQGRSGTGKTTCLVYKLFGRYLASKIPDAASSPRQVLLTRSHVLSHKLKGYTKRLIATHAPGPSSTGQGVGESLSVMLGDDEREVNHTIFTVLAEDFPLVCTFNFFIKLLENTIRAADRKDFSFFPSQIGPKRDIHFGEKGTRKRLYRKSQVVDFEVFSEQYWPTFPNDLTKIISPTLAFMEIIGVIKGSACRSIDFKPLAREEYVHEGHRISPINVDRNHVYDIYLRYEQVKRAYGDLDDIDRARNVLNGMSRNRDVKARIERAFDEIYVDEVQDQRLLEIMMLLHLIKAPNAIHFAGDTAQSISKDSVFRFQNVKDLLYARFSSGQNTVPNVRKLYKNYRTHQGILNVATSVMKLLYNNFPYMVDRMNDEEGQFSGPKPTMFIGFGSDVFSRSMFGATNLDDDPAQFGADQVIIVRDGVQKEKLVREIGDFALILTILESKGMEFEDVLLFDFFSTSECISGFRAVQSKDFDSTKHIALCSELKQLYVAITRAQSRLWFFESIPSNVEAILRLWDPDVHTVRINDSNAREKLMQLRPGKNANPEIWKQRGYQFIENKNYESALLCFRRANDKTGDSLTRALIAERRAKAFLARGNEEISEGYYRDAIKLFHGCKQGLREAACYEALGEFERAGDIFAENKEFSRAADLYAQVNLFEKAAENFVLAERYNDGASILAKGNKFDSLVEYLHKYSTHLSPGYQRHYSRLCNLLLKRGKISPNLRGLAASALNDEEKEQFFREYEMTEQLSALLMQQSRYSEACSLAISYGNVAEAWSLGERYGCMEPLSQSERIEVYSHQQVELLHRNLSPQTERLFIPEPSWASQCLWLSDVPPIIAFWRNLPQQLIGFWKHEITYEGLVFAEPWMKQMFDLIVTLKASAFIVSAHSVAELPVDSINATVKLSKELIIDSTTPMPLLTLLGVLPSRKQENSLVVLQSSLLHVVGSDISSKAKPNTERAIAKWIFCRKSAEQCDFSHKRLVEAEYLAVTKHILQMSSIFCHLLPLYRRSFDNLAPEKFLADYRPRRIQPHSKTGARHYANTLATERGWLERLLAKVTYISAVEQAPGVLVVVRGEIVRQDSVHVGVYGGLDQLLFFRLKNDKDLEQICDVSSMLEQLQVAQSLGVRPNFERSLAHKARKNKKAEESWRVLQTISASLHQGIGRQSVAALDKIIQDADCLDLHSYHAVIALYEKWATYLIYMSNPGDILVPQGWVEMYNEVLPKAHPLSDMDLKSRSREALLLLAQSFCALVKKVNDGEQFQHKVSGRVRAKGQGIHIFARRNVHFLTTCVLNTHSWRAVPGTSLNHKCDQARALVDKTLELPFAMSLELRGCSYVTLGHKYLASFNIYSGKDSPRIFRAASGGSTSFSFLEPTVSKLSLEDWRASEAEKQTAPDVEKPAKDEQLLKDYSHVESSAIKIQRMWRSTYPLVLRRRAFFNTSEGKAIYFIQGICRDAIDVSLLGRTETLRIRCLMFSVGLQLHLFGEKVDTMYRVSRDEAKRTMERGEVKQIEFAQVKWEKLLEMQEKVVENTSFFARRNWHWLQTASNDLETRILEVYKGLQHIEFYLNLLNPREREPAAAIAIQRIWRTQRQVLKQRQKFRASESGKTIVYVQRIVKALNARDPLDRTGEIRRAGILFGQVVQLIQEVKRIEKVYKNTKRGVRLRMNLANREEKQGARALGVQLSEIRDIVCKQASFLSEANWMQLNVPIRELEEKCMETWRVMRAMENLLFRINNQGGLF